MKIDLQHEPTNCHKWDQIEFAELIFEPGFVIYEIKGVYSEKNDDGIWETTRQHIRSESLSKTIETITFKFDDLNDNYYLDIDGGIICRGTYEHCLLVMNAIKKHIVNA